MCPWITKFELKINKNMELENFEYMWGIGLHEIMLNSCLQSFTHSSSVSHLFENMHKFPAVFYFSHKFTFNLLMNSYFSIVLPVVSFFPHSGLYLPAYGFAFVMNNSHKPLGGSAFPHPHVLFLCSSLSLEHLSMKVASSVCPRCSY